MRDLALNRAHRACGVEPQDPAGLQHAKDLIERPIEVPDVLQHAERQDDIELTRLTWERLGFTLARSMTMPWEAASSAAIVSAGAYGSMPTALWPAFVRATRPRPWEQPTSSTSSWP